MYSSYIFSPFLSSHETTSHRAISCQTAPPTFLRITLILSCMLSLYGCSFLDDSPTSSTETNMKETQMNMTSKVENSQILVHNEHTGGETQVRGGLSSVNINKDELESENNSVYGRLALLDANSFPKAKLSNLPNIRALFYVDAVKDLLLSVGDDGRSFLWSIGRNRSAVIPHQLAQLGGSPSSLALAPNRGLIAFSEGTKIRVLDLSSGEVIGRTERILTQIGSMRFSNDESRIILGGLDGRVYEWEFKGNRISKYQGHAAAVSAVAYHPSERVFFSADWNGSIIAWLRYVEDDTLDPLRVPLAGTVDIERGQRIIKDTKKGSVERMLVTPDGAYVILGLKDGTLQVWRVRGLTKVG